MDTPGQKFNAIRYTKCSGSDQEIDVISGTRRRHDSPFSAKPITAERQDEGGANLCGQFCTRFLLSLVVGSCTFLVFFLAVGNSFNTFLATARAK